MLFLRQSRRADDATAPRPAQDTATPSPTAGPLSIAAEMGSALAAGALSRRRPQTPTDSERHSG